MVFSCDGDHRDLPFFRPHTASALLLGYGSLLVESAGFLNVKGNLFDSGLMKTSVISEDFRRRFLSNPDDPEAFEGKVAVFDGSEDYHARIDDPALEIEIGRAHV